MEQDYESVQLNVPAIRMAAFAKQLWKMDIKSIDDFNYNIIYTLLANSISSSREPFNLINATTNWEKPEIKSIGGVVAVNKYYQNYWLDDLSVLTFEMLYFNTLLATINTQGKVPTEKLTPYNLEEVCNLAMQLYNYTTSNTVFNFERQILKKFINYTFGVLGNKNCAFGSIDRNLPDLIIDRTRMMLNSLINEFNGHYIYADTDIIVFRHLTEIEYRLRTYLTKPRFYNIPYSIEHNKCGIFLDKKKYILANQTTLLDANGTIATLEQIKLKGITQKTIKQ